MKKGWELIELKKISDICYGYTESASTQKIGPKFLRITDIQNNMVNWNDVPYCSIQQNDLAKYMLRAGDIVFARTGATTGKSYLITERIPEAVFASYLIRVQISDDSLIPSFLYQYFQSTGYWDEISRGTSGSAQGGFNATKLGALVIPIPPLPEQKRIVKILDEAFAAIDKAKANYEKNLTNSKELFESYLNGIFANPGEDWEEKTLNQISENLDSKRVPITKKIRKKGDIPYYGASGIVDYVEDYLFDENLLCISEDGANLLARSYPIAFSISGKTWVNNHAHVLRFNNIGSQKYVELYLNSIKLDDFVSGMAQPKLNQTMLNKIPIPFPHLAEQQRIVTKLDTLSAEAKKLDAIYQQKTADLDELKKSILKKAFEGEL